MIDFENKRVLVTGGTRGIGLATANAFLKLNGKVWITGREDTSFEEAKPKFSNSENLTFVRADFSTEQKLNEFIRFISPLEFDVLVNNAGTNIVNSLVNVKTEDFNLIQQVNLNSPYWITKAVLPAMIKNKFGRIVSISSIFGHVSREQRSAYSLTKSGLIGFTKAVALEVAKDNVLVNVVSPGFVETELTERVLGKEKMKDLVNEVPMKRLAKPEEIANTILFLSSGMNTYITGQAIVVDGGYVSK